MKEINLLSEDERLAMLYGIMLGDGCLSLVYGRKKYISIAGSRKDDVPFFKNVIQPIIKQMIKKNIPIKFRKHKKAIELNFVHHALFNYIHSFGFPIGKKGNRLFIPQFFYKKNLVKYVLQGFFCNRWFFGFN